ncbi:rhodopsin [Nematostella vectensis]|uniref:Opsin n=1 Tax=Nematostella vectensis TaxID=45351 RepID=A9UMY7_NEMVE|nr:rhodopsin [Nematostella vectensis]FAA00404.1 TPA: opsin [Nematostella vectensis]
MQLTPYGYNLLAGFIFFLILFGCFLQGITLLILLKKENQQKSLTPYLLNIVAANTFMILGSFPTTLVSSFARGWAFNDAVCKFIGFVGGCAATSMIASMLCITITIHRTIAKQNVTNHILHQPPNKTQLKIIIGVWMYSAVIMLPPVTGLTEMKLEAADTNCAPNWSPDTPGDLAYILILCVTAYFIPVGASLFYYLQIRKALSAHMALAIPVASIQAQLRRFQNITYMTAVAIAAFTITWLPYAVYVLIAAFGGSHLFDAVMSVVPAMVAKMSILYNPFVYALVNPRFRKSIIDLLTCAKPHSRKWKITPFSVSRTLHSKPPPNLAPRNAGNTQSIPRFLVRGEGKSASDKHENGGLEHSNLRKEMDCQI